MSNRRNALGGPSRGWAGRPQPVDHVGRRFYDGPNSPGLEIEDRVGFASGFTHGFLSGRDPQTCVDLGIAHGAMPMSTRGDTSQIELEDLMHVAGGGSTRIKR